MFNYDDFPVLASSMGHGSQETQKSTSSSNVNNKTGRENGPTSSEASENAGMKIHPNGRVTNILPGMLNNQFGMAGLLSFLRTIDNSPSITGLALGQDLTGLGLNLNPSKKNLFQTFGGPWGNFSCRIQDLDAKVPDVYLTNATIREKLPNIKLNKLHEDVLFYLFYNCPGEVYQVAAASELYARDWRFHKIERLWFQRAAFFAPPKEIGGTFERCQYNAFDPILWRKVPKELVLEFKDLEGKPSVPGQKQAAPQQQPNKQPLPAVQQTTNNNLFRKSTSASRSLSVPLSNQKLPDPNFEVDASLYEFVEKQLKRIASGGSTLHRTENRHLIGILQENPELFSHSSEQLLDFLQYEPELAGILLVYQLLYEPSNYRSSIEILLNMNIDVSVLVAINKFVQLCEYKDIKVPNDFLHKFISVCILSCDNGSTSNGLATDRLVRMVCMFFNGLLDLRYFDVSTVRSEIQNFAFSYLSLKEASQLYQKTLHL
uniref:CCR4-NOT transcription complex subunit 11 n=2 Tax=Meloidogyne incognita group TaxID=654580 RepID=A0A915LLE0_MELJA